jgi:hypothetical protein
MRPPICLFTYNRLEHTRKTIEALLRNKNVSLHDLIIFSDAPASNFNKYGVDQVRNYIKTISGFRSVKIIFRKKNFGLSKSIITGVTQILQDYESIIVLEDDMITSPYFLDYMNNGLKLFAHDERVVSIHAYVYPTYTVLPETFFLYGADCWGWGTWRRGWKLFDADGKSLLRRLKKNDLIRKFDFNGSYLYSKMLINQIKGKNDSWAIRWYASAFLANKLTLYPGRSLVHNIGNDNSGTHCGATKKLDAVLSETPICFEGLNVSHSNLAYSAFEDFFKDSKLSFFRKFIDYFKNSLRAN